MPAQAVPWPTRSPPSGSSTTDASPSWSELDAEHVPTSRPPTAGCVAVHAGIDDRDRTPVPSPPERPPSVQAARAAASRSSPSRDVTANGSLQAGSDLGHRRGTPPTAAAGRPFATDAAAHRATRSRAPSSSGSTSRSRARRSARAQVESSVSPAADRTAALTSVVDRVVVEDLIRLDAGCGRVDARGATSARIVDVSRPEAVRPDRDRGLAGERGGRRRGRAT